MPPTKHVTGNIFEAYVINALFNMVAQMTGQGVQLLGMLTEAVHTPHLADRALAIDNAQYVFNAVKDFNKEISIDKDGFINKRAEKVLDEAIVFLKRVAEQGFFNALEKGEFADIKRTQTTGKGLDGVFRKSDSYINPFMDKIKQELNIN